MPNLSTFPKIISFSSYKEQVQKQMEAFAPPGSEIRIGNDSITARWLDLQLEVRITQCFEEYRAHADHWRKYDHSRFPDMKPSADYFVKCVDEYRLFRPVAEVSYPIRDRAAKDVLVFAERLRTVAMIAQNIVDSFDGSVIDLMEKP